MSDQMEYYKDELNQMANNVKKCDTQVLDGLVFFMQEADTHMAGISDDVMTNIKYEVGRYKKNCLCKRK